MALRKSFKLSPCFYGPFQILQKIGEVAYKIALPSDAHLHPVFHVSCLKRKLRAHTVPLLMLPLIDEEGAVQAEPEKVLDRRFRKQGNQALTEVLVKWRGASDKDSTWVPYWKLREEFPHLVGKVL